MPAYTLDELIKIMQPQYERDKVLIRECIVGLTLYAAQHAAADTASPKVAEMRDLVEILACYWGLDDGGEQKLQSEFMRPFDNMVSLVPSGASLEAEIEKYRSATVRGLHRYGMEMVAAQGVDSKDDILAARDLMNEIARAWDFESPVLDNLSRELESEARRLEQDALQGGFALMSNAPAAKENGRDAGADEKPSVLAQIREAVQSKEPRRDKPARDKSGPEL